MIKKNIIIGIFISSCLFIQPCYSMWLCCGAEDDERTSLTSALPPQQIPDSAEIERIKKQQSEMQQLKQQAERLRMVEYAAKLQALEIEKQLQQKEQETSGNQTVSCQENEPEKIEKERMGVNQEDEEAGYQIVTYGPVSIQLPPKLPIVTHNDKSKSINIPRTCFMHIFPNYSAALQNSAHVEQLATGQPIRVREKVQKSMKVIFEDMRQKKSEQHTENVEILITAVEKMISSDNVSAIVERDAHQKVSRLVLILNKEGQDEMPAILITVPKIAEPKDKQ